MTPTSARCRGCGAPLTLTLVDLGSMPLANAYIPNDAPPEVRERLGRAYPLHARVCTACWLVQVDDAVPPDEIFDKDYAYFSSFSESWLAHCRAYADQMTAQLGLGSGDLVVEIASNDGYLLQYFAAAGIPVLGVEPAANVAAAATARGVPTRVAFFGQDLARTLVAEGLRPRLICSANVLAHVPDINDFLGGVAALLPEDGVYTVEFPHLLAMIRECQFDTIYHEHFSYLSLLAVEALFTRAGLRVFDVERLATHGGSLRVHGCRVGGAFAQTARVASVRADEAAAGLDRIEGYRGFDDRVRALTAGLREFLETARAEGKRVAAYGAAAKGNTFLNTAGIGPDLIACCVDRNPAKQDTALPGSGIPVRGVEALREDPPDYLLILPWNLRAEIAGQLADLADRGTRFVTAVPRIAVFGP